MGTTQPIRNKKTLEILEIIIKRRKTSPEIMH